MDEKQMTLGRDWDGTRPNGLVMSEKLDGCRAYWDGQKFWSRSGNIVCAPPSLTKDLPDFHLDGEIWAGYGGLEKASAAVEFGKFDQSIRFVAFDCPSAPGGWRNRIQFAGAHGVLCVGFRLCSDRRDLLEELTRIQGLGGEGVILRAPGEIPYEQGRTTNLLKVRSVEQFFVH